MTTAAIVQARMTSTRLPGKVLAPLNGTPILAYMLARLKRAQRLNAVWVATTANATDDPVAELCGHLDIPVFRGDEDDVLGRYVGAAAEAKADTIVRLTADCPLSDPAVIDEAVRLFVEGGYDYLSNAMKRTFPDGLDVEVFSHGALATADREATPRFHREHVTPYMRTGVYQDMPTGDFKVGHILAPADFSHLRWTVDTSRDLAHIRAMLNGLPDDHSWMDLLAHLTRHPDLLTAEEPSTAVRLRAAGPEDSDLLFEWVNLPDSLEGKLKTTAPIQRSDHDAWFADRLARGRTAIWIAEVEGEPAGQVRLDLRDGALEVDIYVIASRRRQGLGMVMLEQARTEAVKRWPGMPLKALVKPDNQGSQRLFANAGYTGPTDAAGHFVFLRDAKDSEAK